MAAREDGGPFKSLADACERVDMRRAPKRAWESLIKVGALDELGERQAMLEALEPAMKRGQRTQDDRAVGQTSLFGIGLLPESIEPVFELPDVPAAAEAERRRWEKELLGLYVTPSPLSDPVIGEQLAAKRRCPHLRTGRHAPRAVAHNRRDRLQSALVHDPQGPDDGHRNPRGSAGRD